MGRDKLIVRSERLTLCSKMVSWCYRHAYQNNHHTSLVTACSQVRLIIHAQKFIYGHCAHNMHACLSVRHYIRTKPEEKHAASGIYRNNQHQVSDRSAIQWLVRDWESWSLIRLLTYYSDVMDSETPQTSHISVVTTLHFSCEKLNIFHERRRIWT